MLVAGSWINDFLDEVTHFPNAPHDDQVDAISLAVQMIGKKKSVVVACYENMGAITGNRTGNKSALFDRTMPSIVNKRLSFAQCLAGKYTGNICGNFHIGMAEEQKLYDHIDQFVPLMPDQTGELEDIAYALTQRSASLANELSQATLRGVRELLRITNSYYSNLIEGNSTHPIDVDRAMRKDYSNEPAA